MVANNVYKITGRLASKKRKGKFIPVTGRQGP
jgi:hypothetical protein